MGQPRLTTEEFENAISSLIASTSDETSSRTRFDDNVFDKVSNLLACVERQDWSLRPRTYALLRMINRPDYMHHFVHHGLKDIHLPYDQKRLPSFLDDVSRHMFMEKQSAVLTKANDLELENGRHRHFNSSADRYFHILGTLGKGKFGVVDHVQSKLSINRFARKRIYRARSAIRDKEAIRSFENELENLKRLRHQHLVTYIGSYTDPHFVGILTIPVADYDLQRFLQQTPFPAKDISLLRQFFGCLCSAVQYLHFNKCRHKDIKPGNILVKNGQVYLTDFGTARDWSDHTKATTVGPSGPYTPRFAAPEVVNCEPRNQSADVWSLGCVYLDMLTVIKGKTVNEMTEFFSKSGSGGISPQNNRQALDLWLNQLKTDRQDNEPIQWIMQMLSPVRSNRPSAESLLEMIFEYEDEHVYYGYCCSTLEESDLDSIYDGSEFEEPTLRVPSISIDAPLTPVMDTTEIPATPQLLVTSIPTPEGRSLVSTPTGGETMEEKINASVSRPIADGALGKGQDQEPKEPSQSQKIGSTPTRNMSNYQPPSVADGTEYTTEIPPAQNLPTTEYSFSEPPNNQGPDEQRSDPLSRDSQGVTPPISSSMEDETTIFAPEVKPAFEPWQRKLQPKALGPIQIYHLYGNMLDLVHMAHLELCAIKKADNANDLLDEISAERETEILSYRFRIIAEDYLHGHLFVVLGHTFETHSFGWWLCLEVQHCFSADSFEFTLVGKLWQFLLELECRLIVLAEESIALRHGDQAQDPWEFYRSGRRLWWRLENLLQQCEVEALGDFPRLLDSHLDVDLTEHNSDLARSVRCKFVETLVVPQLSALEVILLEMRDWNEEFSQAYKEYLGSAFSEPIDKSLYPFQWNDQTNSPKRSAQQKSSKPFTGADQNFSFSNSQQIFEDFFKSELMDETGSESAFGAVPPLPPRAEEQHDSSRIRDPQDEEDPYLAHEKGSSKRSDSKEPWILSGFRHGHSSQDKPRKPTRSADAEYDGDLRIPTPDKADSSTEGDLPYRARPKEKSSSKRSASKEPWILSGFRHGPSSPYSRRLTLEKADSSPAAQKQTLRGETQRSATVSPYDTRREREETQTPPKIRRAKVMPATKTAHDVNSYGTRREREEIQTPPKMRRSETMPATKATHYEEKSKADTSQLRTDVHTEAPRHMHESGYSSPGISASDREKEKESQNATASRKTRTTYIYGADGGVVGGMGDNSNREKEKQSRNETASRKTRTTYRYGRDGGVAISTDDDIYNTITIEPELA